MIPYEAFQVGYWFTGLCSLSFVVSLLFLFFSKEPWAKEAFVILVISSLAFLLFGIITIDSGASYNKNMTICNKVTYPDGGGLVVTNDQEKYSLSYDPIINMKSQVDRPIVVHIYQTWLDKYPIIYDIDGPIPCGNSTCGV